jgi:hypothetical protein
MPYTLDIQPVDGKARGDSLACKAFGLAYPYSRDFTHGLYNRKGMRKVWKELFNITIKYAPETREDELNDDGYWIGLEFESESAAMLWLLEWS